MKNDDAYRHKVAYSIKEAVAATSLSRSTIYVLIAQKKLESVRVNGRALIPASSLNALIAGKV
ncbi:helix-turn-helix domain-containing protein [Novosphingobium album (ex Hu et al. 2023)]|uniref:Helix-turn-helix domain-containing protein n=1 Tax=Novosphingobium album (ex Hu et al. 2023) TaxID=2930093 RepID=A0ABT0B0L8_9SPHN|nr:helix-turn-helix domain-containing protein [Novosphingobium album (ex Hu et al. 2023)]MCJ2178471.1 helix-turn-helix domain-containing protein [Novosphingobium album (ex Hu et al. 2023)]